MATLKDLTGQRFGRLTVIRREGSNNQGHAVWRCHCDCGTEKNVVGRSLRSGNTMSCGCLRNDGLRRRNTTHGKRYTRLHAVWLGMKERCYNPNYNRYYRYGGRGIAVCDEWRDDFQVFHDWAMSNGYDENAAYGQCTLDRIDNNKGYSPDNCRWVDIKTQNNNKCNNRKEKMT